MQWKRQQTIETASPRKRGWTNKKQLVEVPQPVRESPQTKSLSDLQMLRLPFGEL